MSDLGWAIVGTGQMASIVADAVPAAHAGRVRAVLSRSRRRAEAFARLHGVSAVASTLPELLGIPDVDIVYLASPNALHAAQARECIRAGRHVLCDKPLATRGSDAEAVRREAAAAGVTLGTTFQCRYQPTARHLRAAIGEGRIGRVMMVKASVGVGTERLEGWRARPSLAGAAAVFNIGVHAYDIVRFLVAADVKAVTAMVDPPGARGLDRTALALLRLDTGALAYVQASQELPVEDLRIEIFGTAGSIEWRGWLAPIRSGSYALRSAEGVVRGNSACPDAYVRLVRSFADAVGAGTEPDPSPQDAVE
ncbi:MAG TPA: Gfo/Idh/MocA family oxidoreductase, partial [Candidatus Dormibacteraeota bacterium]|nr:Gfo/Idh/MocA family oxidoreductase [Candidatus Dormibacteraeota bacterium]